MFDYKVQGRHIKVTKDFKRPCKDCCNFRWLSVRFGVCELHERPSEPSECLSFKRKKQ